MINKVGGIEMKKYLFLLFCSFVFCMTACSNKPLITPKQTVEIGKTFSLENITYHVTEWSKSKDLNYIKPDQADFDKISHDETGKLKNAKLHYVYVTIDLKNTSKSDQELYLTNPSLQYIDNNVAFGTGLFAFDQSQHPNDMHDYGKYLLPAGEKQSFHLIYIVSDEKKGDLYLCINPRGIALDDDRAEKYIKYVPLK